MVTVPVITQAACQTMSVCILKKVQTRLYYQSQIQAVVIRQSIFIILELFSMVDQIALNNNFFKSVPCVLCILTFFFLISFLLSFKSAPVFQSRRWRALAS
jgi:hypothetical protein